MSAVPAFGVMEMLLFVVFGTGIGIPLGVPPGEVDPRLAQIAPDECLFYSTWAGMADADPASGNQTEQLLAEPEVKQFVAEVEAAIQRTFSGLAARDGDPRLNKLAKIVPEMAKALGTRPTAVFCERFQPRPGGVDVVAGLVVNVGDDAGDIGRDVGTLFEMLPDAQSQSIEIAGTPFSQVTLDPEVPKITWGIWEKYLVIGAGAGAVEGVMQRASDSSRAVPQWLVAHSEELSVLRPSTFSYVNLDAIVGMAAEGGGRKAQMVIDLLGLSSIKSLASVSGLDADGFVSRSRLATTADPGGIVALLRADPLTAADLAEIPQDASVALAFRLDVGRWFESVLDAAQEVEPRAVNELKRELSKIEQVLGFRIREDLLALLGDVWTLHTSPSSGGLMIGWTATVSLRDGERFENVHNRLLGFAQGMLSRESDAPRIKTSTFAGETIYTLDVPDVEFFVSPSWCVVEDRLVVALLPQTIKSYLSRKAGEGSLADQSCVAELLAGDSPPFAISYQDTRAQFELLYPAVQLFVNAGAKEIQRLGIDFDPSALPSVGAIASHLGPTVSSVSATDKGIETFSRQTLPGSSSAASAPVLVGLLLPAIQSGREASRRAQSMNHLKQLALAMHNYHDRFKAFPAAFNVDEDGKPLLSWRVHILQFVEQSELYEQFHLDEPWDSDHNKKLIPHMPALYRSPNAAGGVGMTVYLGNASKQGIFTPPKGDEQRGEHPTGVGMRDITDGASNTIAVVEASNSAAVIWTKPEDFQLDQSNPTKGLIGMRPGGFLVGLCDGAVRFISVSMDPDTLKGLFTRDGSEIVDFY